MTTYVMGDIHGAYKALLQCLQKCNFDYSSDTLIQLGDVADGYEDVYECVEELLKIKHLISIKGNHDEWFYDFICSGKHEERWAQGGKATAISYLRRVGKEDMISPVGEGYITGLIPRDIPETHKLFFKQQLLYHIDGNNNCFVHAGFNRTLPFTKQPEYLYFWDRELWQEALSYEAFNRKKINIPAFRMETVFNEIFIGHTSTIFWKKDQPMKAANIYNIDTGAGYGGRLTVMDISTKKYWQSDPVKKLYGTNHR